MSLNIVVGLSRSATPSVPADEDMGRPPGTALHSFPDISQPYASYAHLGEHTQGVVHLTWMQSGERYISKQPAGVPPRAGLPS
jgi:hypothetical protein